jgi:protein TonB
MRDARRLASCSVVSGLILACGVVIAAEGATVVTDTAPVLIPTSRVSPEYPPAAFAARFQGAVTLRTEVLPDGTVGSIQVLESTAPNLGFEQAAERAIRQWRFEPATLAGEPVAGDQVIRLSFGMAPRATAAWVSASMRPMADIGGAHTSGRIAMGDDTPMAASHEESIRHPTHPCPSLGCMYDRKDIFTATAPEIVMPTGH